MITSKKIKLIECPRDAIQGIHDFIPTSIKAHYINLLLEVGFDTIDFGSFVSAKAIPQMQDTADLVKQLDLSKTSSQLLAIIANLRGAKQACDFDQITYLGFPFSISETFQLRNTNADISESLFRVEEIQNICISKNKELVIYLSMGFGNPYGDTWSEDILNTYAEKLVALNIKTISLADTTGVSNPEKINQIFPFLQNSFADIEWGMHLHSTPEKSRDKIQAAFEAGCTRFDSALKGFGGCPMAMDKLTGNIPTEIVINYLLEQRIDPGLNLEKWQEALDYSHRVFN